MKRLFIKRVNANIGIVYSYGRYFEEVPVTGPEVYVACKAYVKENQEELTIYKIGRILNRKNAKRTLDKTFLAADEDEAMSTFIDYCAAHEDSSTYQLLTGNWKLIAERLSNGLIKII